MNVSRFGAVLALLVVLAAPTPPAHAEDAPESGARGEQTTPPKKKVRPARKPKAMPAAKPVAPAESEPADKKVPRGVPAEPKQSPPRADPAPIRKATPAPAQKESVARPEVRMPVDHPRTDAEGHRSGPPPAARSSDHRYARPAPHTHRTHPDARHPPPAHGWYSGWYHHWWVHPWYRWTHATVAVVWFDFRVDPWVDAWAPPARSGWVWVPGYWIDSHWIPGHWRPVSNPPPPRGAAWVWVPGWWIGPVYIEGYWRLDRRSDGDWVWVDGMWLPDGTYVWGYWAPAAASPEGYVWEPGFWDGEVWVEGFWRPVARPGYRWVSARYGDDGIYRAGYWEPVEARPGSVWVPGWFDGNSWQAGYWVDERVYQTTDPSAYVPAEGWDDYGDTAGEAASEDPVAIPAR